MKRVTFFLAFICGIFALTTQNAQALAEFCPARLALKAVASTASTTRGPASLFGFELSAMGPRSVGATLAFDTSGGWFTATVPPVALTESDMHYTEMFGKLTLPEWDSPVMYARFPSRVTIAHAWVYSAAATGDGDFGWEKQGLFACPPPAPGMERLKTTKTIAVGTSRMTGGTRLFEEPQLDIKDVEPLGAVPSPASTQFKVVRSRQLQAAACSRPFADATARRMVVPEYPAAQRTSLVSGLTGIEVAVNGDGSLIDSWVWASSGVQQFDAAALGAVRESTFVGAVAYCNPVPALYNYYILFDSR